MRCPKECRIQYQNIKFTLRTRRIQPIEEIDKEHQKIGKVLDPMNLEDIPECIWPFTHLFNKNKFEKLLEKREQNHKINLLEDRPKELDTKAYIITVNEDKALN